ncbi:Uncharacterised protein [Arcanobacterium haemolyticum]|uniref:Uncharacterized protein n=1 Tax=Arcanobacterium haemolyticum (strain ATCC 9345 / DSM 20595 / CCM 5947 / CCUG 17215 / LMG 16163 / NBRC 15585 / NCTC 8452 / 11018) TaxID=644284 RepID=D7BLQ3_ARCHD|nr:hypothetical protein Arch_0087 [Arcanobacterium haemolyticum DSM 20595]SQH27210.1 Uncharacterised protein [Arcanobacterium haemolyticum]
MARLTREKRPKRDIKKIYLLAVEGETEKRYFELMPSHLPYKLSLELGATPIHIPL